MSPFDNRNYPDQQPEPVSDLPESPVALSSSSTASPVFAGDAAPVPVRRSSPIEPFLPPDLRISWSWLHLFAFLLFAVSSIVAIQIVLALYISAGHHWSAQQMERALASDPNFLVGSNVIWFALLLLFLYVSLSVLRGLPFWYSLGWRKLRAPKAGGSANPWIYFVAGCILSLFIAGASSKVKNTEHVPIQELFNSRNGAFLLMAMAVLVAPLVEETVFRGYLYPLFANKFAGLAYRLGVDPPRAVRIGMVASIVVTGVLFGLLHGTQLGWTWGLVSLLIFVGIVFTVARAVTGTVFASFLLHLGYNSTIAITSIVATHGFRQMPPLH